MTRKLVRAWTFGLTLGLALSLSLEARAGTEPNFQATAALLTTGPSALGAEGGLALLFHPIEGHELLIGPKISLLAARGSSRTRLDLNSGVEGTFWLVNAIGPGLVLDVAAPSTITGEEMSVHFRVEPILSVRFKRLYEEGAWALRIGIPFDSTYKWGIQLGVALQFSGVPVIGDVPGL